MSPGPTVRAATAADCAWIIALTPRLHAFGPPPWRPRDQMDRAVARVVETAILRPTPGATVLAAFDPEDRGLGFIHLHPATDFFTGEAHGHISDLVVAPAAEGRGVGRALMAAAEAWARERGYRLLTLNVFDANQRARALYERLGYRPDVIKLVKPLR